MNKNSRYFLALFVICSAIVLVTNLALFIIFSYFNNHIYFHILGILISSILSGILISWIIIHTSPIMQTWFSAMRRLVRLDTLSHPILLRLAKEAPSTFQHSLQVGNLANYAAKSISADAFLARIGGYYHDVGKLIHPNFFIENSGKREDKPENLNLKQLKMLARGIQDHITDGMNFLAKHGFPQEVIAFIPQHHGTMPIAYFYEFAKKLDPNVKKHDFYYRGPKPLSKESAIIMIADATESRIRSLDNPSKESVRVLIDQIILDRVKEKQFVLSGLSDAELKKISIAMAQGIAAVHHKRIKYPSDSYDSHPDR